MSVDLALQAAMRARLIASAEVLALVPADSILDRHERPALNLSIILGETQLVPEGGDVARRLVRIVHSVHIWKREPSLVGVKQIAAAVAAALRSGRLDLSPHHAADLRISGARYMRDPDGITSHGLLTVEAIVKEATP